MNNFGFLCLELNAQQLNATQLNAMFNPNAKFFHLSQLELVLYLVHVKCDISVVFKLT